MFLHAEETPFPLAVSGCLSQIGRTPILVGLTCLRALQLSGYGWIKAIIHFFQVSCKCTEYRNSYIWHSCLIILSINKLNGFSLLSDSL